MKNKKYILPVIFSLLLIIGILIGNWYGSNFSKTNLSVHSFLQSNNSKEGEMSFSLLPRNNKLSSILSYINNEYVDTVDIGSLSEAAIPAVIEKLDPHSVYIPATDLPKYNEPLVGNFSGIGITFNMDDDTVAVINTIPNGPSEIVGIRGGDRIVKVDGVVVAGVDMPTDTVVGMLRGEKGTSVRVSVVRRDESQPLEFEIIRDDIPLYSVDVSYMITEDIGYLKISAFSQTTFDEFVKGVSSLHEKGMNKLILDLRGNGGGVMETAVKIADQFLDENKLIVFTKGEARPRKESYSTSKGICKNDEVVVLIDEFSASASEILAGAIQDNDRGTIIGRRSFGKGLVQEQIQFRDGSALRLTIARYYTPTGRSIQKPYENGREDYYMDIHNRYDHGEFINADSIQFADSLRYVTPGGKVVYGGGGIMPDIFVPVDTSGITPYFNKVRNLGLIFRFAFNYADENRNVLEKYQTAEEIDNAMDNSGFFQEFVRYASSEGVKPDWKEINISEEVLKTQIKAYTARNLINNEGFYPIISQIDNTLSIALKNVSEDKE